MTSNKPYREMSDDELRQALQDWGELVENASGWASCYFAAKQVAAVCDESKRRGLNFENAYPIQHT